MAHYNVYWRAGKDGPPLASHWYTLGVIIVWASPVLEDWVGKRHADLEVWLREENGPWWAKPLSRRAHKLDDDCVPPTQKYHKQLMQCIAALVEQPCQDPTNNPTSSPPSTSKRTGSAFWSGRQSKTSRSSKRNTKR